MKSFSYYFISLTIGFVLAITLSQVLAAFSEPSTAPSGGNTPEPINISGTTQYKTGAFGVGGVFQADNLAVFNGNLRADGGLSVGSSFLDTSGNLFLTGGANINDLTIKGRRVCLTDGTNCPPSFSQLENKQAGCSHEETCTATCSAGKTVVSGTFVRSCGACGFSNPSSSTSNIGGGGSSVNAGPPGDCPCQGVPIHCGDGFCLPHNPASGSLSITCQ